jgi:predicted DCC family thiol-disulfide oxidoreductase YuxK
MADVLASVEIIYDGQCPACAAYFRLQRLEESGITARLIDARGQPELVSQYAARGIDFDRDFVLRVGRTEYVGSEAAMVLAALGARHGVFRRLNYLLFCSTALGPILYALMRGGRRALLLLLGRSLISPANSSR